MDGAVVIGQGQDVGLAILHVDGQGDGAVAGDSGGSGLLGVPVGQLHSGLAAVPGDDQLVVLGNGQDVGDAVVLQGNADALGLGAVSANGADFQSDDVLSVLQSGDVVLVCVSAANEAVGAVGVDSVDVVVLDLVIGSQVPGDLILAGALQGQLQIDVLGGSGGIVSAVGDDQAAQVQLVALDIALGLEIQADGSDDAASVVGQVHGDGVPAADGGLDGQVDVLDLVAVLQGQNDDLLNALTGDLVVGQGDGGTVDDVQLGLVQVDELLAIDAAVDGQGVAAVVAAQLGVGELTLNAGVLGAVVPLEVQQGLVGGLDPPLPGGQDVLQVQVGPLGIADDLAAQVVVHAVAGVEVGGEDGAGDDGLLDDVAGDALEVGLGAQQGAVDDVAILVEGLLIGEAQVLAADVGGVVVQDVLSGRGEVHTLTLVGFPLILDLVAVVVRLVVLLAVEVGAPDGQRGVGLAVLLHQVAGVGIMVVHDIPEGFQVDAEAPLAALEAHVDGLVGVQAQGLGVLCGILDGIGVVPVVQEHGVGHAAQTIGGVVDEVRTGAVESVLIGDGAGVGQGVIPLDVSAPVHHVLHDFLQQGNILLGNGFLLVDEVAVEAIVFHDLQQLVSIGEAAILGLLQPLLGVLRITGQEVLGDGQDAVLVGGVGGSSHGDGDGAVLLVGGAALDVLGGTAAGTGHVGVLPELEQVVAELIVGHTGVPGSLIDVGGTIVGRGDGVQLGPVGQVRIGLGGGVGVDALLQRDLCNQLIGVGISLGVPIQDVHEPVAVAPGFVGGAGFASGGGLSFFRRVGDGDGSHGQDHHQSQNERQSLHPMLFHNTLQNVRCVWELRVCLFVLLPEKRPKIR